MTQALLDHHSRGRNPRTALVLAGVWGVLILLVVLLDAALWIVAGLGLFTCPRCGIWSRIVPRV